MSLAGCDLVPVKTQEAEDWLRWVSGALAEPGAAELPANDFAYLLAHCDDGVVWGHRRGPQRSWVLSSAAAPDLSPPIGALNLQQLRLFGTTSEVLLWRTEEGIRGRRLTDRPISEGPEQPASESRVLVGNRLVAASPLGFSRVRDADGREQVVPLVCTAEDFTGGFRPLRLDLRHYFERDAESGAVRPLATRLVDARVERAGGRS